MAEGLLRARLEPEFGQGVRVQSAGTLGIDGNPATAFAIQAAAELGADIQAHRSQGVTEDLIKRADLIFCMAHNHQQYLNSHFPRERDNVFLLRSFDRTPEEKWNDSIDDPIGSSLELYRECAELIDAELERILPRLRQLIGSREMA